MNIMSLKVYYDLLSQPCRAIIILLRANKIPFEPKEIKLAKGEHYTQEFEKISPFRKVPVIVDGDFPLIESVGILRYLCREKNIADHWYPRDSKKQAKVDEYLEWQHFNTRAQGSLFFLNKFMFPAMSGRPANPEVVAKHQKKLDAALDAFEDVWLKKTKYLAGNEITIADLLGACEIEQTRMAGYDPCEGRPKLSAWLSSIREELKPYYDEAHVPVNKIVEKHKGVPPVSLAKI